MLSELSIYRFRVRLYIFYFVLISLAPLAIAQAKSPKTLSVSDRQLEQSLAEWTKISSDYIAFPKGLILAATPFPQVAKIYIQYNEYGTDRQVVCSGVLIQPRQVLTAGHCICGTKGTNSWYFDNYESCSKKIGFVKSKVFFPISGIVSTVGKPILHPKYRSISKSPHGPKSPARADLAILNLEKDIQVAPAEISNPVFDRHPIFVSYGTFEFSSVGTDTGFKSGIKYQDGVKHLSVQRKIIGIGADCDAAASSDSICTEYNSLASTIGTQMDAGACKGDSGGALFLASKDKTIPAVVGLASYFHMSDSDSGYDCGRSRMTFFTHLGKYKDWIIGQRNRLEASKDNNPDCQEAIFWGPKVVKFQAKSGILSATAFDEDGVDRPTAKPIGIAEHQCQFIEDYGMFSCRFDRSSSLSFEFGKGIFQLTFCATS